MVVENLIMSLEFPQPGPGKARSSHFSPNRPKNVGTVFRYVLPLFANGGFVLA